MYLVKAMQNKNIMNIIEKDTYLEDFTWWAWTCQD